jgi:hypothetical protein
MNHCGDKNPIEWLKENWRNMIDTVVTLATNYGHERKENNVGTISAPEARDALRLHRGNVWAAVTECVEQRQKKVLLANHYFCIYDKIIQLHHVSSCLEYNGFLNKIILHFVSFLINTHHTNKPSSTMIGYNHVQTHQPGRILQQHTWQTDTKGLTLALLSSSITEAVTTVSVWELSDRNRVLNMKNITNVPFQQFSGGI